VNVAIVTGASQGIGAAVARRLLARGDAVVAVARERPEVEGAHAVALDVGDPAAVERAVARAAELGPLRTLVNCAGVLRVEPVEATPPDEWDRIFRTNVVGPFLVARAAIPHLRATGGGAIVNVGSVAATAGTPMTAAYGASKAALVHLTRTLAVELAPDAVRVNAVSPGLTRTPMAESLLATFGVDEGYVRALQGRWLEPEELAEVVEWLSSDDSAGVSGAHLVADLGQTTRLM
jgi:NAD(P)-dependent dehydrogenase (short-subunit alcohol dehydrogenase family)